MLPNERDVAGLRCSQVLEILGEYLDGQVAPAQAQQIAAHVSGCDLCERFGGRFAFAIQTLRTQLAQPAGLDAGVEARLAARLARDCR